MYEKVHVQNCCTCKIVAVAVVMANAPQYPNMKHWCLQNSPMVHFDLTPTRS